VIIINPSQLLIANEEGASPYARYGPNGSIEVQ